MVIIITCIHTGHNTEQPRCMLGVSAEEIVHPSDYSTIGRHIGTHSYHFDKDRCKLGTIVKC